MLAEIGLEADLIARSFTPDEFARAVRGRLDRVARGYAGVCDFPRQSQ